MIQIYGGYGNDVIIGGLGFNDLYGGGDQTAGHGQDDFRYSAGSIGYDIIYDLDTSDTITLGAGLTRQNLIFTVRSSDNALLITFNNTSGTIHLPNWLNSGHTADQINFVDT